MKAFRYDAELLTQFPTIVGGVIIASDVTNGPTPPELSAAFVAEQQATLERIGDTPLSQLETISAWRSVFSSFGVKPTQYRNAAEALLRRLTKKGDIPSINKFVDMGNMISIRYGLPVAFFDTADVVGEVTVRTASGDEQFTDLGADEIVHPEPGEVVFVDDNGMVIARRWCWRQADQSASRETTTQLLVTVEGHHQGAQQDIQAALNDLKALVDQYAAGQYVADILNADNPVLTADSLT